MRNIGKIFKHVILIALALVMLFPVVYVFLASFKTNMEILANPASIIPEHPTLDNYKDLFNGMNFPLFKTLWNSTYYTTISVCITLFLSSMLGYVFARGKFKGKGIIFGVFIALMFVNLGSITMYPNFETLERLHISKGLPAVLLIKCFGMPMANVYLVKGFIEGIPYDVDEAARIDGCSFALIFFRIILPMLTPILATIAILTFNGTWNDYMTPMIYTMTKPEQATLIVKVIELKSSGAAAGSWNLVLAGTTIALIPVLIIYIVFNRMIVDGIAEGAVKG